MSPIPGIQTAPLYRLYYGIQFNANGTETDMGYRYLTTNPAEADFLEGLGPVDKRAQRDGTYFREQGVNNGSAILGYIYLTQQPGTIGMNQVYRLDEVDKPTRQGNTQVAPVKQQNGDHLFSTNPVVDMGKKGTWRLEAFRGYVRELSPNAAATAAPVTAQAVAEAPAILIAFGVSEISSTESNNAITDLSHVTAFNVDEVKVSNSTSDTKDSPTDASDSGPELFISDESDADILDSLFTDWNDFTDLRL